MGGMYMGLGVAGVMGEGLSGPEMLVAGLIDAQGVCPHPGCRAAACASWRGSR